MADLNYGDTRLIMRVAERQGLLPRSGGASVPRHGHSAGSYTASSALKPGTDSNRKKHHQKAAERGKGPKCESFLVLHRKRFTEPALPGKLPHSPHSRKEARHAQRLRFSQDGNRNL